MTTSELSGTTAIVTGVTRGFGRAITTALVARGVRVVGVARGKAALDDLAADLGSGLVPIAADAADPSLASQLVHDYRPRTIVLNAGAAPAPTPLSQQTWESLSVNWETDVRQVFNFAREALTQPLAPGSTVISFSSGAAIAGSALSGGYAGAKAAIRFLSGYAAAEAEQRSLGIRFVSVLPQITRDGGVGAPFITAYADYDGITEEQFLANFGPPLHAGDVASAVVTLASQPEHEAAAYRLTSGGLAPLP
jgi:NAD(P)-dependent dehydrogenase (short-subunit alcohol dehydrogenase family)